MKSVCIYAAAAYRQLHLTFQAQHGPSPYTPGSVHYSAQHPMPLSLHMVLSSKSERPSSYVHQERNSKLATSKHEQVVKHPATTLRAFVSKSPVSYKDRDTKTRVQSCNRVSPKKGYIRNQKARCSEWLLRQSLPNRLAGHNPPRGHSI